MVQCKCVRSFERVNMPILIVHSIYSNTTKYIIRRFMCNLGRYFQYNSNVSERDDAE